MRKIYYCCFFYIKNNIISAWREEAANRDYRFAHLSKSETINGKVSCRSCDYYLGEISWIRKRNQNYFVRHQQFMERIEIERFSVEKIIKEIQLNGILHMLSIIILFCMFFPLFKEKFDVEINNVAKN